MYESRGILQFYFQKIDYGISLVSCYINVMSKDDIGNVEFAGKTQTFKQFQLESLIREGTVMPASKSVEAKAREL
jgi:hypothetical protein